MGIFSKVKITLDQLAENHADFVFRSISDESLGVYVMLLRSTGENEEINEKKILFLLLFEKYPFLPQICL